MTTGARSEARPRAAVIGGGIFGITAALALADSCDVWLFERSGALCQGATFANHNRQHFGFHYPRSPETARQCLGSREDFRRVYGEAEFLDFPNFYFVATEDSKVTPQQYLKFCKEAGLEYREESPPLGAVEKDKVALSLRVQEGVLNLFLLRDLALARLKKEPCVQVCLQHEVMEGSLAGNGEKRLMLATKSGRRTEPFDFVVNATYAHSNAFCGWFGFEPRRFQFNLQELDVIELPRNLRLGLTVMDGPFPSFLPWAGTPYHLLAHVNASQLVRDSSESAQPLLGRVPAIESNWAEVLEISSAFFPILRESRYVKSLFVDRVVDAGASLTDARLTELTDHGSGCFSIFAAKIITCVSTAGKLAQLISTQL